MFPVLFVLVSLLGHPQVVFNSESGCKKAMETTRDMCVKVDHPYTLWAYDYGGPQDYWYVADPAVTLSECIDGRDNFRLHGESLSRQAEDRSKHPPFCLPTGQATGRRSSEPPVSVQR